MSLLKLNITLEFISITLKLSEFGGVFHEELPAYSFGALVSDIGGALGLVLGLSIVDFLVCSGNMLRKGFNKLASMKRKQTFLKKVSSPRVVVTYFSETNVKAKIKTGKSCLL